MTNLKQIQHGYSLIKPLSKKIQPQDPRPVFSNEDYLAELLTEAGLVSAEEVDQARNALSGTETIVEHLLDHTSLTHEGVAQTLATNAAIPFVNLGDLTFDPAITETITQETASR
ncbi:MAG: hypothetical protein ACQCXQ_06620, partial [Verrucomicrobiales bacterium]